MPTPVGTAAQGGAAPQSSPLNITHNSGATGTNRCLVVGLMAYDAGSGTASSIAYGGNNLTAFGSGVGTINGGGLIRLYYLVNPPTGSNTLVITTSQQMDELFAICQTFSDVNQTTPLTGEQSATGASGTATIPTITLSGSDIGIGAVYGYVSATMTITESDTLIAETHGSAAASGRGMQYGDANLSWTVGNSPDWLCLGANLVHDAGGGGGTVNTETLSDTAVLIDEGLRYVLRNRLAEDAIQASDELLRQVIYRRLGDDLLSIIDEAIATYLPAGGTTYTETLSDTLVISDDMIAYLLRNRLAEDVVVVTDPSAVTTTEYNYRAESSVDVVDAEFHWMRRFRLLEESLTLVDELISALVAQAQVRTLTDALTITDELLASRYQTAVASDSLTIIDALLSGVVRQVLTIDAVDVTDSTILQRHLTRQLEDAVTIDDAVSIVFNLRRVLTDELAVVDSATATKTGYVAYYGTTRAAVGMRGNPVAVGLDDSPNLIGLAA